MCRFVDEYFKEPHRGYGRNVITVFELLRQEKFSDPYGPARKQFDGAGSRGNGGAMRISPAAVFAIKRKQEEVDVMLTVVSRTCFSELIQNFLYTFECMSVLVCMCV